MRTLALPVAALLLALPARAQQADTVPRYGIDDFLKTTTIFGASFSPDGSKVLVSGDWTGIFNAYAVPVAGGEPVPLTNSTTDAVFAYGYFPRDERIVYQSDRGGNELSHVYVRETNGTVRDLTPGDSVKGQFVGWAHDLQSFYVRTNERDRRFFDLYEIAADGYARSLVFRNDGYDVHSISRDERYVALQKNRTTLDSDVWIYDRRTNQARNLTAHTGNVANAPAAFSPDGRSLYVITDQGNEFAYLARIDLESGARTEVLKPEWDVMSAGFSHGGRYLVVRINQDAATELRVFEVEGMRPVQLPTVPGGSVTSATISRDERRMALYVESSRSPQDLYVMDLPGGPPRRLTRALNPRIDAAHLADARVVRFASYDGVQVPGLLYRPHGASPQRKVPAVVLVHGGPGGQARIGYDGFVQYLVNHGYAVFDINNRGSSGYGKTFYAMDDRRHGEADLDDVVASKKMLAETGWVDPERIGIVGGSYGGFMVLAALAFRPEEFRAGVNLFGVANWLRTLQSIPPWWESFKEALYQEMGDPATDEARLRRISPLFHADRIRRPLMVLQGANDPRVLQAESDEIVAAVRRNGTPVEYILFPDEGHGFVKRENQVRGYDAVRVFLDRYLKGAPGAD